MWAAHLFINVRHGSLPRKVVKEKEQSRDREAGHCTDLKAETHLLQSVGVHLMLIMCMASTQGLANQADDQDVRLNLAAKLNEVQAHALRIELVKVIKFASTWRTFLHMPS